MSARLVAAMLAPAVVALAVGGSAPARAQSSGGEALRIERLDARLDALIPPGAKLEAVADGIEWAEGPVWDPVNQALLFSDVPRNGVYRWTRAGGVALHIPKSGYTGSTAFSGKEPGSNGLAFDREGRLVTAQHGDRRIVRREPDGRVTVVVDRYQGKRLNSPNDLVFGPNGHLYFTDPPFGLAGTFTDPAKELPFQGVFHLAPDGTLTALATDLRAPNGIGFSPDGRTLYVSSQEERGAIWMAYPVLPDGNVGPGRRFADAFSYEKPGLGVADGLKVDERGNVFGAGPGGGIHIFAPDGARLGRIVTGVPTGNLAWGEDGSVLYIAANHRLLRLQTSTRGR
jgi:gluconolactonase